MDVMGTDYRTTAAESRNQEPVDTPGPVQSRSETTTRQDSGRQDSGAPPAREIEKLPISPQLAQLRVNSLTTGRFAPSTNILTIPTTCNFHFGFNLPTCTISNSAKSLPPAVPQSRV
ncbi:hypothetical protein Cob_v002870 [Colletotrichum orbiculare MAFF 240422]|uniref:Uncharacterized protein n=1 Tax=Colletotrichum orbiculare (strain 104-T / ATCC 96160 / CBS 514.97 / LARS 414 / MAFF 240422) TaxID=1213857 RepID=A0A484G4D4_COLOR|nr:hypothetical protein Cob_v002870 [Colletotrichum orbiculare MAFF 240422]